jgi:hypothetical protein
LESFANDDEAHPGFLPQEKVFAPPKSFVKGIYTQPNPCCGYVEGGNTGGDDNEAASQRNKYDAGKQLELTGGNSREEGRKLRYDQIIFPALSLDSPSIQIHFVH